MSNARYPEWQADAAEALIAPIVASEPGPVLLCLQAVQAHFGYVPADALAMILLKQPTMERGRSPAGV